VIFDFILSALVSHLLVFHTNYWSKSTFHHYWCPHCRDGIVTWLKKKASPSIHNITTKEEAERVLSAEPKLVFGFLNSLVVCIL